MDGFTDYQADTGFNNLVIQRALGEVDTGVLITAMAGLPEEVRGMFYRNMSSRTNAMCKEEIASRGPALSARASLSQARIEAAQAVVLQALRRCGEQAEGEAFQPDRGGAPEIRLDSPEAVIATFRSLASYVRKNGFLPLEAVEGAIDDPVMRKGIELRVDGWEPLLSRSILEKYKASALRSFETRLDMILEGMDALASRDLPQGVEERLRAHLHSF
jgi:hypothetical protein